LDKLKAIIIGATGAAGQNIVEFIDDHPWFEIDCLAASRRSHGLSFKKAIEGIVFFEKAPKEEILDMKVINTVKVDPKNYDIAFSALPSNIAKEQEAVFAKHIPVVSTTSAYRYEPDVPIVIPDVNPDHVEIIEEQKKNRGWDGFIIPGPNCTTVGLVTTLKPLNNVYCVDKVSMVSMQALSGAGAKGLRKDSSYRKSVIKNVLPFISGEERKVTIETNKILGTLKDGKIVEANLTVHTTCARVFVENVHTEAVHIGTKKPNKIDEIKKLLSAYRSEAQDLKLPSASKQPIIVLKEEDMPQPIKHRDYPAMVTLVGRLRKNKIFENGLSYVLTSDNLEKGAGGGAVLTAEYLHAKDFL
jgi:aspartate-semialdehyde dehydrogenase